MGEATGLTQQAAREVIKKLEYRMYQKLEVLEKLAEQERDGRVLDIERVRLIEEGVEILRETVFFLRNKYDIEE